MSAGPYRQPEQPFDAGSDSLVSLADRGRPFRPPSSSAEPTIVLGGGSGGGTPPTGPNNGDRKLAAKRYNEGVKLVATALNNFAVAVVVTAILQPMIADASKFVIEYRPVWYFVGVGLHIVAQVILRYEFRSEE